MAKRIVLDPVIDELKKLVVAGNVTLGADKALDGLKKGTVGKVYLASNYPQEKREDIKHYAQLSGAEIVDLEVPNDELGTICKKPFSVSVISVAK